MGILYFLFDNVFIGIIILLFGSFIASRRVRKPILIRFETYLRNDFLKGMKEAGLPLKDYPFIRYNLYGILRIIFDAMVYLFALAGALIFISFAEKFISSHELSYVKLCLLAIFIFFATVLKRLSKVLESTERLTLRKIKKKHRIKSEILEERLS